MSETSHAHVLRAARDPEVQSLRGVVVAGIGAELGRTGDRIRAVAMFKTHHIATADWAASRDEELIALGHLGETAAALLHGARQLVECGNAYSASALNRQLVELEYLAWAFANDPAEAKSWQTSTKGERLKRWQPRHLRERSGGTFRGADYSQHCEIGGHPTPDGMANLLHGDQLAVAGIVLFESAMHGGSLWRYYLEAIVQVLLDRGFEPTDVLDDAAARHLVDRQADWDRVEGLPAAYQEAAEGG